MKCFLFCRFCLNLLITTYIASSCFLFICFLHSPFSVLQGHPGANFFSVNVFVFHIIFPLLSCFVLFIQVFTCFFCLCRWPSGLLFFSNRGPWRQELLKKIIEVVCSRVVSARYPRSVLPHHAFQNKNKQQRGLKLFKQGPVALKFRNLYWRRPNSSYRLSTLHCCCVWRGSK